MWFLLVIAMKIYYSAPWVFCASVLHSHLHMIHLVVQMHAEMQEIAAVEADVARLKQKLAEFHTQFSQQNHLPYVIDSSERQRVKSLQAQQ